jgi:hypothetical protein
LHNWLSDYLTIRHHAVILPGVQSNWSIVKTGVSKGSILGPLLFLNIFIYDIVEDLKSKNQSFADETSLHIIVDYPASAAKTLQSDISLVWKMAGYLQSSQVWIYGYLS